MMPAPLRAVGTLLLFELLLGTGTAFAVRDHPTQAGPPVQTEALSVTIPLDDDESWQLVSYSNIPSHDVDFSALGLRIQVNRSVWLGLHFDDNGRARNLGGMYWLPTRCSRSSGSGSRFQAPTPTSLWSNLRSSEPRLVAFARLR